MNLSWVEVSKTALEHNIRQFMNIVGPETCLCSCVKANAYGHGLVEAAKVLLAAGADWLAVDKLYEAKILREAGVTAPIIIIGYVALDELCDVVKLDCRLVIYNRMNLERLSREAEKCGKIAKVHLKVETGNNRQGVMMEDLVDFASLARDLPGIMVEGLSTHFANIEDTTDHSYAEKQYARFLEADRLMREARIEVRVKHCSNTAATLLFPDMHFDMVRVGIGNFGMWPSNETYVSYLNERGGDFKLIPAFTWKTRIAQIKTLAAGEYIGYGCTYRTGRETKLAILPVGYYDGYDRGINNGYVLINGKRAPIRGRICMNIMMVEVTDIEGVQVENEVVLMGRSGDEEISAEQFAQWAGTINYEVTTRVNDRIPRVGVDKGREHEGVKEAEVKVKV